MVQYFSKLDISYVYVLSPAVYKARFITCFKANPEWGKNLVYETRIYHYIQDTFSIVMTISATVITDIPDDIHVAFPSSTVCRVSRFHPRHLSNQSPFASGALILPSPPPYGSYIRFTSSSSKQGFTYIRARFGTRRGSESGRFSLSLSLSLSLYPFLG